MALIRFGFYFLMIISHIAAFAASPSFPEISSTCQPSSKVQFISTEKAPPPIANNTEQPYRKTSISRTYLQEYDYFLKRSEKTIINNERDQSNVKDAKRIRGKFAESATNIHYFYETDVGLIMLTRWEFSKEGGGVCVPWATINFNINGDYGGLVLVSADEDRTQCEWRASLFLNSGTVNYRLAIKTRCSDGKPEIDERSVIRALKDSIP